MKFYFYFLFVVLLFNSCTTQKTDISPEALRFHFGSSMEDTQRQLQAYSDSIVVRRNEPMQLPTATKEQSQLDVYGYDYAGKKRLVELIFADDVLDIAWILTDAEEEATFIDVFADKYGEPTHVTPEATFFIDDRVAVKHQPHEVLYISERLVEPYKQFLKGQ